MPSNLESEFDALTLESMDRLVAERRQENLHLDFKEIHRAPEFGREDRKNLAESISGFANSDGGIIVWGIEARRDADGVDAAQAKKPISGVEAVLSALNTYTGSAVSPVADGVRHRCLLERDGAGYIMTLVPRSETAPHMAKLGEDRYFKRSGSSFIRLEHFDLEDMFGRRPRPRLTLVYTLGRGFDTSGPGRDTRGFRVVLGIENEGRGVARFPYLMLRPSSPYRLDEFGLDGNRGTGLPRRISESRPRESTIFCGGVNDVIHPGTVLEVTSIRSDVSTGSAPAELKIDYSLGADAVALTTGQLVVSTRELEVVLVR